MSGYSYSDEIAASFDHVRKYLYREDLDAAIDELQQLQRLVSAELEALLEEVRDAERANAELHRDLSIVAPRVESKHWQTHR